MVKVILYGVGIILSLAFALGGYNMYQMYSATSTELMYATGVLASDPVYSYDYEFDKRVTRVRLFLKGERAPLSIAGKLLDQMKYGLGDLKAGDTIQYHILEKGIMHTTRVPRILFSLKTEQGITLLPKETGLAFAKRPMILIVSIILHIPITLVLGMIVSQVLFGESLWVLIRNL